MISGGESLHRLEEILETTEPPAYEGARRIGFRGGYELRDVSFSYGEAPVLEGVDIEGRPGEWVALAGPNGAGKSTIAALVLGLYRPDLGTVLADGIPMDEVDVRDLRRRVAVVPQDAILFAGTVAENIAYGFDGADRGRVEEAARQCGGEPALAALSSGYDTEVGDEGGLLSGGQRQSVALARALLRKPSLLILDEPTTSLDRASAPAVLTALRELPWEPAVLLISHDPVVLAFADRHYEVEAGRVTAVAPPLSGASVDR